MSTLQWTVCPATVWQETESCRLQVACEVVSSREVFHNGTLTNLLTLELERQMTVKLSECKICDVQSVSVCVCLPLSFRYMYSYFFEMLDSPFCCDVKLWYDVPR